ncbi:MAG: gliding motility-associated C-terminal domain-containing protein [Bacteroidales bacterium]|jgi:hypothetical protein
MKKVILLAAILPYMANGQIIENFESASLDGWIQSKEGHWNADTSKSISGNYSLHHIYDSPSAGSDCIGLPLTNFHPSEGLARWTFSVRHGYDPSSSNNWCVLLMSDTDPVSFVGGAVTGGYAVGVNLTGYDDTLRLWKIKGSSNSVIVKCPVNWQNDIGTSAAAKIIAERTIAGEWEIIILDREGILKGTGTGSDAELFRSSFLILNYRYTSSCDRLLWLDDLAVEGVFYEDRTAPSVSDCIVSGPGALDLTIDEEPDDDFMLASNFSLAERGTNPVSIEKLAERSYKLQFSCKFRNKVLNNLIIKRLCDRSGNCNDNVVTGFIPVSPDPGDVIISEMMADPLPPVSLPGKEYLEIMNRSRFGFNLKKWKLSSENQSTLLPAYELGAGECLILCAMADTSAFSVYGKTIGLKSFPALTDEGRLIYLSDSLGNLVHGLEYSSSWYGSKIKSGGGWSLEMIDTGYPFFTAGNWEASSSATGGTPGRTNSVSRGNPDLSFYGIENVFPADSLNILMRFSETIPDISDFVSKIMTGGKEADSVSASDPLHQVYAIRLSEPLKKGKTYRMVVSGEVRDFAGNPINRNEFSFGMPLEPGKGDILFNELLFNPLPDDPDYIELVNNSERVIDASGLYLASVDDETGDTSDLRIVSSEHRCIIQGGYYTATTDRIKITSRYLTSCEENIFNTAYLPSMPDDKGHLLLLSHDLKTLDEVRYTDKMHFALLTDDEGISLEKVRPDLFSDQSQNWHSASESCGWGTPGKENSIYSESPPADDQVSLSSKSISPDNDGKEDVLVIDINAAGLGNVVSVTVFNETGSYIRKIMENFFAEGRASVVWDGTRDDGSLVRTGIYIIYIELYNDRGKTKSWKKVCTVARK